MNDEIMRQIKYQVEYVENGQTKHQDFEATGPGEAFAYCLIDHPSATLVKARCEGFCGSAHGFSEYPAPAVQRPPVHDPGPFRKLKKNEKGCEFPFYDEVKVKPVS